MTSLRWVVIAGATIGFGLACGTQNGGAPPSRPYPAPEVTAEGKVVAKIGEVTLTTAELERRIQQQSPFLRAQLKDPEQKKKFIENEIRVELLAQEGWKQKLYDHPQIIAELKRAMVQKMMKDQLATLAPKVEISDAELADAYARKEADYNKPEKIRLSQIFLRAGSAAEKAAAKKKLEGIREEIAAQKKKGVTIAFSDAARKYSEDEMTKRGGGDLQFFTKAEATQKFGEASANTIFDEKFEIGSSLIAENADGVALLEKTGRRRGVVRTLEMVKPQLRSQLLGDKRNALFDQYVKELMNTTSVEIDEDAAREVKVDMAVPTQPGPQNPGALPIDPTNAQPGQEEEAP